MLPCRQHSKEGQLKYWSMTSHWGDNNIDLELLDPRVDIMRGGNKHLGMVDYIEGFDGAFFIGYHARAGGSDGVGNESNWGREIIEVRMNGNPVGEAEVNAAVAGYFGVPVIMVSGDDCFCNEIKKTLSTVEVADRETGDKPLFSSLPLT